MTYASAVSGSLGRGNALGPEVHQNVRERWNQHVREDTLRHRSLAQGQCRHSFCLNCNESIGE